MTDRKIELDNLSEDVFQEVLTAVNSDVLKIAKTAQDEINDLLLRFNIKCSMSLSYQLVDPAVKFMTNLPEKTVEPDSNKAEPPKAEKKRGRKKKA